MIDFLSHDGTVCLGLPGVIIVIRPMICLALWGDWSGCQEDIVAARMTHSGVFAVDLERST